MRNGLDAIGIPFSLFVFVMGFLSLLILVSGIGMRHGAKWGWYLGSFPYAYSIVTDVNTHFYNRRHFYSPFLPRKQQKQHIAQILLCEIRHSHLSHLYPISLSKTCTPPFGLQNAKKWPVVVVQFAVCIRDWHCVRHLGKRGPLTRRPIFCPDRKNMLFSLGPSSHLASY